MSWVDIASDIRGNTWLNKLQIICKQNYKCKDLIASPVHIPHLISQLKVNTDWINIHNALVNSFAQAVLFCFQNSFKALS